ncbi:MAG: PIG-L family deacetylase [Acidobacteriota bacterium]
MLRYVLVSMLACLLSVTGWACGIPTPDYRVTFSGPDVVKAGEDYSYFLGGTGALTLTIPADLTVVRASMPFAQAGPGVLAFGPYPPGFIVEIVVRAPLQARLITAVGQINPQGAELNPANNVARIQTIVRLPRNRGAVPMPPRPPQGASLVWVGAHPDDEILIAGLMGRDCVDGAATCTLVTATRGEKGECSLSGGCLPDLGTVREAEFRDAAAVIHAEARVGDLPDGSGGSPAVVLQQWSAAAGGRQNLVDTLIAIFRARSADVVFTFDPRHGSTCHPDHRAVGELTAEAVAAMGADAPQLWLLEDVVEFPPGWSIPIIIPAADDPASITSVDLNASFGSAKLWDFVVNVAKAHPSQNLAGAFANVAAPDRRLFLLAPWRLDPADPRYLKCGP